MRDALEDRARDGRPHTSARRPYGYAADARTVIEAEALVLREMFARYLDGATPREIAEALNDRGQPAAGGGLWHPASVRRMLRSRHVTGIRAFVTDAAVQLLTHLDVTGAPTVATALSEHDEATIAADEHELAELKDMWNSRELSTREYRQMRKTVEDRITTLHRKTIVRPTVEVLAGLVGPHARASWDQLAAQGEWQRLNAVLRFLFAAVIVDEHRGKSGTFDYSRIDIEPNPL
ncbi:MAG: recombinase family protein [Pseudonocardiaceae bacterium]